MRMRMKMLRKMTEDRNWKYITKTVRWCHHCLIRGSNSSVFEDLWPAKKGLLEVLASQTVNFPLIENDFPAYLPFSLCEDALWDCWMSLLPPLVNGSWKERKYEIWKSWPTSQWYYSWKLWIAKAFVRNSGNVTPKDCTNEGAVGSKWKGREDWEGPAISQTSENSA